MTMPRTFVIHLTVETDLSLRLLKNLWGWRCCNKFVKVTELVVSEPARAKK